MKLPAPLSRKFRNAYKNNFGHVLVLAGSPRMLGAGALTCLSAMRSGAGLVTLGIPHSLNLSAQKKISNVVMTLPLAETRAQTLSPKAFREIHKSYSTYDAIALGPGLSRNPLTQRLIIKIIQTSPLPLVIDADALTALSLHIDALNKTNSSKILTPHPGEMARLIHKSKNFVDENRNDVALNFVKKYHCALLLKGARTVVASPGNKLYTNRTGNVGMATAGSGDILTGMIAAFVAQGIEAFQAACLGSYLHGKTGDLAASSKTKLSMIASDMIDHIPQAVKRFCS